MNSAANQTVDTIDLTDMRHAMVTSQLRTNAVDDQRVVTAMAQLSREDFVPSAARAIAYRDTALPAGEGRWINPPLATGRLLTEADLVATDRVLLIGAAGGYAAALLATIVAAVTAVEQDDALVRLARSATAGLANVTVIEGVMAHGHAEGAPYDVLIVDGAVELLPDALIAQVKPGGRVTSGLLDHGVTRLASGRRSAGGFGLTPFVDSECVVLPGFAAPRAFRF